MNKNPKKVCVVCGQNKTHYSFRDITNGICKKCELTTDAGLTKKRPCLKCDKTFLSINGLRICGDCKRKFEKIDTREVVRIYR